MNKCWTFWIFSCYLLFLFSCERDTKQKIYEVEISSDIDSTALWTYPNNYIIKKKDFTIHGELIIQSGVIVNIEKDCNIIVEGEGRMVCQGTIASPIVFTSPDDAVYGINTLKNTRINDAQAGDWNSITISSSKSSVFNTCQFSFGGGGELPSTIKSENANVGIKDCLFTNNKGGDISKKAGVVNFANADLNSYIISCRFYDNELPLSINPNISVNESNLFTSEDKLKSNKYNLIFLNKNIDIIREVAWYETEVAYVVTEGLLVLDAAAKLTLANAVVLKFGINSGMYLRGDSIQLFNGDGSGVAYTSINDDTMKGDSNGDGTITSPQVGQWRGIFNSNIVAYKWNNIRYGSGL